MVIVRRQRQRRLQFFACTGRPHRQIHSLDHTRNVPGILDDVELLFAPDSSTVGVRCEAQVTLPPPPFCLERNCINGNLDQRRRVEAVARVLGLPPSDQVQMQRGARWTPIFFNADRVPGFNDDDDETMRGTKVVFVRHWYGRLAKQTR